MQGSFRITSRHLTFFFECTHAVKNREVTPLDFLGTLKIQLSFHPHAKSIILNSGPIVSSVLSYGSIINWKRCVIHDACMVIQINSCPTTFKKL